jgi:hypothetical protein
MLSGPTLYLTDIDGQPVGSCAFESGRCEFMLPSGVYSLRLDGDLPDGTPVDAHGRANVAAMQSDGVEYLHGPLAVWHENPGAVAGLVLVTDESGVAQPLLDAAPTGTPAPLDPLDRLLEPKAEPTSVGIQVSRPPTVVTPLEAPGGGNTRWLGLLLWLLAFGVLIGGYALGMCLRRRRRRREPHAAE